MQVGAATVATRFVVAEAGPSTLALLRYAIGVLCLLPALGLAPRMRFARGDLLPVALLGIAQFGILVALLNLGLRFIPAARGALLFATFPVMTMLIAAALGREALSVRKAAGVSATIAGVGLALGGGALGGEGGAAAWLGSLAVLGGAFTGALCSVMYRPYLERYPALPLSALAMAASVVALAPVAALEILVLAPPAISVAGWAAIAFIGASSGAGYLLWLLALARTTPTRVSVFLSLSPITAALLGAALLGEPVTRVALAGLALVVFGLWLSLSAPSFRR